MCTRFELASHSALPRRKAAAGTHVGTLAPLTAAVMRRAGAAGAAAAAATTVLVAVVCAFIPAAHATRATALGTSAGGQPCCVCPTASPATATYAAAADACVCLSQVTGQLETVGGVALTGGTALTDAFIRGSAAVTCTNGTSLALTQRLVHGPTGAIVIATDTFTAAASSVHWALELTSDKAESELVRGDADPSKGMMWTTGVTTALQLSDGAAAGAKWWTTWGYGCVDNGMACPSRGAWRNPLSTAPLQDVTMRYGNTGGGVDAAGDGVLKVTDAFSVPMVTLVVPASTGQDAGQGTGVTIALSPQDTVFDLQLEMTSGGAVTFNRAYHRLSTAPGFALKLNADIVVHGPGWRPGLKWMVDTYGAFFEPVVPAAQIQDIEGLGSYSSWLFGLQDPGQYKSIGYQTNWDLSGTFMPYDGIFLPPVSAGTTWKNDREGTQEKLDNVTFKLIDDYYAKYESQGLTALSYFDIGNFGTNIQYPPKASSGGASDAAAFRGRVARGLAVPPPVFPEWQDPSTYLWNHLNDSILLRTYVPSTGTVHVGPMLDWQKTADMDPAPGSSFQGLLTTQLQRHLDELPHFKGIAIDRSDYLSFFNMDGDDGLSLVALPPKVQGGCGSSFCPARSLLTSYASTAEKLGAMLHGSTTTPPRVMLLNMFGNARLDIMQNFDGSFSEGAFLNNYAWLSVAGAPATVWTYSLNHMTSQGLDNFFQQHLLMGAYPMAPYPSNDHSILPDNTTVASWYVEYGALFNAVKGHTWALDQVAPVRVSGVQAADLDVDPDADLTGWDGAGAAVAATNVFDVPSGDVIVPVMMSSVRGGSVSVTLSHLPSSPGSTAATAPAPVTASALHPVVNTTWVPLGTVTPAGGSVTVSVPLVKGCAVVKFSVAGHDFDDDA